MHPEDKIVIIGGGVAGLSCGCYLQMNGYRSEILELNRDPGGLCVAWDRGPYVFDGCLRWLTGTHPSSLFHRMWTELGAIAGREITNQGEFLRVEGTGGQSLSLPADLNQLADTFKRLAPEDAVRIDTLVAAARRCAPLEPPDKPLELMSGPQKMRLVFRYAPMMLPIMLKWKNLGLADYIATYRNPFLREVLAAVAGDPRMSALVLVMVLAIRCGPNAGFVAGGSRALSEAIARRYSGLGGTLTYATQVDSVTVENSHARGVVCADGKAVPAGTVVSCADGYTTIFKMLAGRYTNKAIRHAYENFDVFPSLIQVSLGIGLAFLDAPSSLILPVRPALHVDDRNEVTWLELSIFGAGSGFCPAGKTVIIARFASRYEFWTNLKNEDPAGYRKAKARLLNDVIQALGQRFPGLPEHVENSDLATPASFERWTGNWRASYQGWLPTRQILGRRLPRTLPGLKNFYMAGHWVEPGGGLPPAALSGRYVAQMICARDGREFGATPP